VAFFFAVAAQDHFVAILEKLASLSGRELDGLGAAPCELEKAAARFFRRAGDRAAREEIAGLQIAAVRRVVRDELGNRPVHVAHVSAAETDRLGHLRGAEPDFDLNVEGDVVLQVVEWLWIALRALKGIGAERLERVERDDPWGDRRREVLREKG